MAQEINDLSGPFNPDLKFEDMSKEFLLKIMGVWQEAWLELGNCHFEVIAEQYGLEVGREIACEAWRRMAERVNPKYPEIANIKLDTVVDSLKCLQLPLDNVISGLFKPTFEIINENHVIETVHRCLSLEQHGDVGPELIDTMCGSFEQAMMSRYMVNPKIKIRQIKAPPPKGPEEPCCQWEFTMGD